MSHYPEAMTTYHTISSYIYIYKVTAETSLHVKQLQAPSSNIPGIHFDKKIKL